jgi:hypothetical protein
MYVEALLVIYVLTCYDMTPHDIIDVGCYKTSLVRHEGFAMPRAPTST